MRNIKLVIEYDGSRYDGWQKPAQGAKGMTIQEKLEEVLSRMDNEKVEVIGAARTEAGVHACAQIANFHTNTDMTIIDIKHYLNRFLPRDIAVLEAMEVPERFHASYLARAFRYEYRISIGEVPSVFERKYRYYCFKRPDVARMNKAAKELTVYGDEREILITMTADDFWPNMARIITGTLLEAGLSKIEPGDVRSIIDGKDRAAAGERLEAKGLFLTDVFYE